MWAEDSKGDLKSDWLSTNINVELRRPCMNASGIDRSSRRLEILNPVFVASLDWLETSGIKAHKPARCSLGVPFQASFEDTVTDGPTSVHIVHMGTFVLLIKTRQAAHLPGAFHSCIMLPWLAWCGNTFHKLTNSMRSQHSGVHWPFWQSNQALLLIYFLSQKSPFTPSSVIVIYYSWTWWKPRALLWRTTVAGDTRNKKFTCHITLNCALHDSLLCPYMHVDSPSGRDRTRGLRWGVGVRSSEFLRLTHRLSYLQPCRRDTSLRSLFQVSGLGNCTEIVSLIP